MTRTGCLAPALQTYGEVLRGSSISLKVIEIVTQACSSEPNAAALWDYNTETGQFVHFGAKEKTPSMYFPHTLTRH